MSFGSSIGSSALSGVMGNALSNLNAFHRYESNSWLGNVDWLGGMFGDIIAGEEAYQDQRQLSLQQQMLSMQSAYQQQLAHTLATQGPSWQKEGLKAAGYNPLLALGYGNVQSPSLSANAYPTDVAGRSGSSVDIAKTQMSHAAAKIAKSEAVTAAAEARLAESTSALEAEKADIELEAIRDEDYHVDVDGKDSNPTRTSMRQMIRNSIERSAYTNSREHAIAEDAVNAIHGGSSAMQGFQALENARNIRRWRNR